MRFFEKKVDIYFPGSSSELNFRLNAQMPIFKKYNLLVSTSTGGFFMEPLSQFLQARKLGAAIVQAKYHETEIGTTISLSIVMNPMGQAFGGVAFIGTLMAEVGLLLAAEKTFIQPKLYFDVLVPFIIVMLLQKTMFKYSWQRVVAALKESLG